MENPAYLREVADAEHPEEVAPSGNSAKAVPSGNGKGRKLSYLRQVIVAAVISSGLYVVAFLIGSTSMLPVILNANLLKETATDAGAVSIDVANISSADRNFTSFGYTAENVSNMNNTKEYPNIVLYTEEDLKWLASAPILLSILGNILAALLSEYFGPTFVFRGSLGMCFLFNMISVFLPTLAVLWVSRTAMWIIVGTFDITCVPLIALLIEPDMRGLCGAFPELTASFGLLLVFVAFSYLRVSYAILCHSVPIFLGFLGSFFVPESPYWLVQRGRPKDAAQSFARVLGPSRKEKRQQMLQETISSYEKNYQEDSKEISRKNLMKIQVKLLTLPKNWKPVLLAIVLFAFREFGGHNVIFFYALSIFQQADIDVDMSLCTIIVGVARVLSTFLSSMFQDRLGRRTVLIGSTSVSSVCLSIAGLILLLKIEVLKIVPLIAIIVFILMTGVGMGPVPFILVGELIPSEVKFLGTGLVYSLFNLYQFIIVNLMPGFLKIFSLGSILVGFAVVNFFIALTLYFILPETKRKTLTELDSLYS